MLTEKLNFNENHMNFTLLFDQGRLQKVHLSHHKQLWVDDANLPELFAVDVNGQRQTTQTVSLISIADTTEKTGMRKVVLHFENEGLMVDYHIHLFKNSSVVEMFPVITNPSSKPLQINRVDSVSLNLTVNEKECLAFTGNWGSEFEPVHPDLSNDVVLESRTGRSSKGNHPWISLTQPDGGILCGSVVWSGNWILRVENHPHGLQQFSGGLHHWEFSKILHPGEQMQAPAMVLCTASNFNAASQNLARVGRKYWYPKNPFPDRLPIEWNHWWPYEDAEINEQVFLENIIKAGEMGFDVCTLDAGWFGPSESDTFWEHYRGDWDLVNTARFPNGIRPLADATHKHGMKFGIWCEIEALGEKAHIAQSHPEYVAKRNGTPLGYVCFGNPAVQEWAFSIVSKLVNEYQAAWIKFDFNLDPGAGCNREDHGHQHGDGLFEHYMGYYQFLERVRTAFPKLILESCSSGGLRIDLGLMRQVHCTFLSDPDWPEHDLQIFWGASCMLPSNVLLHWTYSHWRNLAPPPYQKFDPYDPSLTIEKWDYLSHISMLGMFGLSQKLPELPAWMAKRVAENNHIYIDYVQKFVQDGDLYRLTDQPLRSGKGDRWAAFQYSLTEDDEHLLFVFRLPGSENNRIIRLKDLKSDHLYTVREIEGEIEHHYHGYTLMTEGLHFTELAEEESALIRIY